MNAIQKELIKATVPVLKSNGNDLITYFYQRMLSNNPELKNIFNMANQASGKQQNALTAAVLAYAENIEDPSVLINVLKSIGNKHVSLNIAPEQYDIVGNHLIASIKEVLADAATEELLEAWTCAYTELAQIMIGIEAEMYKKDSLKKGSWLGWRKFTIAKIVEESDEVKSFYLQPEDGKDIADFFPGQYLSVKTFIPELGYEQPRQYSISTSFNNEYYRISVKKEKGINAIPDGIFSNVLHTKKVGETIDVSAPAGVFYADPESINPLVLISGGVGATPLMSMVEANKVSLQKNKTVWVHSCRNENVHAFKDTIEELNSQENWLTSYVFYETLPEYKTNAIEGRVDLHTYKEEIIIDGAKYYICGPELFIKKQFQSLIELGVTRDAIFYEEFGPQSLALN
ncbi:NO-inducible flavohemoprotein [Flavobacterium degerlachei]|jgi:nitric oxide dioxygenase|uniref:Flavohemoprotein n=1 Tax=Flavobacterium degerlachei TaxID=229203 RepID=A0A1H3BYE2_9FLAO|nr:NO-inducible flavohemoprotein [Flavobacterium degerlachei]SDX46937.1 nitric oxide dioxygenase [Flavobacterium degerlachei]